MKFVKEWVGFYKDYGAGWKFVMVVGGIIFFAIIVGGFVHAFR